MPSGEVCRCDMYFYVSWTSKHKSTNTIPPTQGKKSPAGKNGSSSSTPDWQLMYCTMPKRILAPPLSFKGKWGGPSWEQIEYLFLTLSTYHKCVLTLHFDSASINLLICTISRRGSLAVTYGPRYCLRGLPYWCYQLCQPSKMVCAVCERTHQARCTAAQASLDTFWLFLQLLLHTDVRLSA